LAAWPGSPAPWRAWVFGAAAGTAAGHLIADKEEEDREHDEKLDEEIGVIGGNIGAAKPGAPRARIGAPSAASSGAGGSSQTPAEGPIQDVDD
jgi:hypothetical protein